MNYACWQSVWPSDAQYGIPVLQLELPEPFLKPYVLWGETKRTRAIQNAVLFYVDDYRFSRVVQYPDMIVARGCRVAAEVNLSIFEDTPRAVAIYKTWQKRMVSRYWQSQGVCVWVDMHVSEKHQEVNLLGVPDGYGKYITRGSPSRIAALNAELGIAKQKGGNAISFAVYAGGEKVKQWCVDNGCIYLEQRKPSTSTNCKELANDVQNCSL